MSKDACDAQATHPAFRGGVGTLYNDVAKREGEYFDITESGEYLSLGSKYFDETEELYDKMWEFTHRKLGSIGYDALYIAARELGMTVKEATAFCTSKWIRHNEDYLQEMFAQAIITAFGTQEMFSNMMNYTED